MQTVKLIYDNAKPTELRVPAEMGSPNKGQLIGLKRDRLAELAGRVCYDSLGAEKSRGSVDFHAHIREVGHLSVYEHPTFTVGIPFADADATLFLNRPALWVIPDRAASEWRVTLNLRHAHEWRGSRWGIGATPVAVYNRIAATANAVAPLSFPGDPWPYGTSALRSPDYDAERYLSFYVGGVSRGLSHELVRHGDYTAISQRSTRYCDESESDYAWHPLTRKFYGEAETPLAYHGMLAEAEKAAKRAYAETVDALVGLGHDRKSARGAARGVLGNALATELIFTASLPQWREILRQRGGPWADQEIREMAEKIREFIPE